MYREAYLGLKGASDCAVNAVALACNLEWEEAYDELCADGRRLMRAPNERKTIDAVLSRRGFAWYGLKPSKGEGRPTVRQLASDLGDRVSAVASCASHVVAILDTDWLDKYDSGDMCVYGYWLKRWS